MTEGKLTSSSRSPPTWLSTSADITSRQPRHRQGQKRGAVKGPGHRHQLHPLCPPVPGWTGRTRWAGSPIPCTLQTVPCILHPASLHPCILASCTPASCIQHLAPCLLYPAPPAPELAVPASLRRTESWEGCLSDTVVCVLLVLPFQQLPRALVLCHSPAFLRPRQITSLTISSEITIHVLLKP